MKLGSFSKLILLSISLSLTMACSTQWREVDASFDSSEVIAMIDEIAASPSAASADSTAMQEFLKIKEDPNSEIYFSFGPGELGPVLSILSLADFSFLGSVGQNLLIGDIEDARVFFAVLPDRAALLIDLKIAGQDEFVTRAFLTSRTPTFDGEEFVAVFGDQQNDVLAVRSFDVTDGSLNSVIQLKVYDFNTEDGSERRIGKFSTLVGFGP